MIAVVSPTNVALWMDMPATPTDRHPRGPPS
jgi:hypothetical protein